MSHSVAPGEQFHRLAHHGCALPSGQKFPRTDPCDAWAWRSFRNALPYGEVAERTMSEACWAAEWSALEPWTFVTGWIWLLSRADLHGDERSAPKPSGGGVTDTRAPQSRASQSPFCRRKKRPEARGSFRPYLWCRGRNHKSSCKPRKYYVSWKIISKVPSKVPSFSKVSLTVVPLRQYDAL